MRFILTEEGTRHLFSNPDESSLLCGHPLQADWERHEFDEGALSAADLCQRCWFILSFSDYGRAEATISRTV